MKRPIPEVLMSNPAPTLMPNLVSDTEMPASGLFLTLYPATTNEVGAKLGLGSDGKPVHGIGRSTDDLVLPAATVKPELIIGAIDLEADRACGWLELHQRRSMPSCLEPIAGRA